MLHPCVVKNSCRFSAIAVALLLVLTACTSADNRASTTSDAVAETRGQAPGTTPTDAADPSSDTGSGSDAAAASVPRPTAANAAGTGETIGYEAMQVLVAEFESKPGTVEYRTSIDGNVSVLTTVLTTEDGRLTHQAFVSGRTTEWTTTVELETGQTLTNLHNVVINPDSDRPYIDRAGYQRDEDGQLEEDEDWQFSIVDRLPFRVARLGTIDDPIEMPQGPFSSPADETRNPYLADGDWEYEFFGLMEVDPLPAYEGLGTCVLLVASTTRLRGSNSVPLVEAYSAADLAIVVDGEYRESDGRGIFSEPTRCDVLPAFDAGYGLIDEGSVGPGATNPIFASFVLDDGEEIDAVALSLDFGGDWPILHATLPPWVEEIPEPDMSRSAGTSIVGLDPDDGPADVIYSGVPYRIAIDQLTRVERTADFYGSNGVACWVITGEITRLEQSEGDESFNERHVGLVADGLFREAFNLGGFDCDTSAVEAEGRVDLARTQLVANEPVQFFLAQYFETWREPELIAFGLGRDASFFEMREGVDASAREDSSDIGSGVSEAEPLAPGIVQVAGVDSWCEAYEKMESNQRILGPLPRDDRNLARLSFTQTLESVAAVNERAPAEISAEMQLFLETWEKLVDLHRAADWSINDVPGDSITAVSEENLDAMIVVSEFRDRQC